MAFKFGKLAQTLMEKHIYLSGNVNKLQWEVMEVYVYIFFYLTGPDTGETESNVNREKKKLFS